MFRGGGINTDDAPEFVIFPDVVDAVNMRTVGTASQEDGYRTNIESTTLLAGTAPDGLNKGTGGRAFNEIRAAIMSRYNTNGNHQLLKYDYDADSWTAIYTDIIDSDGEQLLTFDPKQVVSFILINDTYLIWAAKGIEVGYTNLNTLQSGGYGTVLAEDLSLIKPQCLIAPTGTYGSDAGQPANYWFGRLPAFTVQYVNADFNYSAWSTWSKRIGPYQQNTPTLGSDVSQNNYIIIGVDAGSIRAQTINIARQIGGETVFYIIKSVDRSYVIALPNTAVDPDTEIYEAYDPSTNIYSYVSYGNEVAIPVAPTETDLGYDYIWPAGDVERINNNLTALADLTVGYDRPSVACSVSAVGYDPNIDIPAGTYPNPLRKTGSFPGASGSGAGDHKRRISISLGGTPHTGDKIIVVTFDLRNATSTRRYEYVVPSGLDGNLPGVVAAYQPEFPSSSYTNNGDGTYTINWVDYPYFQLQTYAIQLFFAGAAVANSIPSVLDNATYQLARRFRDKYGRYFPLDTTNSDIVNTPSYAQVNGQAIEINVTITDTTPPVGAVDVQFMITKPPIRAMIDTLGTPLNYIGTWDASTNTPLLEVNAGTVGDTYQITTPASPAFPGTYHDLGNGASYPTGAYVTYNGQSWDVLPKEFGDLTSTGTILAFSLNPLNLFNSQYAQQGISTILGYDFSPGDRCTLHYYIDTDPVYINDPCVNLSVFGYDAGSYIVKVEKPANFDTSVLNGKNVFLRLYSPGQQELSTTSTINTTLFREIGERIAIVNGAYEKLSLTITDGGVYYKTRQFLDGLDPYADPPVETLSTDLNYSDFYASAYWSGGRPGSYYDELERTERKAIIARSEAYVLGSRRNGLTRFFPENVYGEVDGQTSSSFGAITKMWMRGDILVIMQALNTGYVPVNLSIIQDAIEQQQIAISEKLFGNIRYNQTGLIGIGTAKESFWFRNNNGGFIDPMRSEPMEIGLNGVQSISGKQSKYFKSTLQTEYAKGRKLHQFYDSFYEEVPLCISPLNAELVAIPFSDANWRVNDQYTIANNAFTSVGNGAHSTVAYDTTTGNATYTPAANYVGNDVGDFTFNPGTGAITKHNCLTWTAGSGTVSPFSFTPAVGVELSTDTVSNSISVFGNDYAVPVTITGGTYSKNGGSYTSSAGTAVAGDTFTVKVTSSGSFNTTTTGTLTIDSQSANFDVTTKVNGNFTVSSAYGFSIDSITNGTSTGIPTITPTGLNTNKSFVYTAITAGDFQITISGSAALPGHVKITVYIDGVFQSTIPTPYANTYTLTIGAATDPQLVLIALESF